MSLQSITFKTGCTISSTGGSDLIYTFQQYSGNSMIVANAAITDTRLRPRMTFKVQPAQKDPNAPNGYTQIKLTAYLQQPELLANGKVTVNTSMQTMWYDVETAPTKITAMRTLMSQLGYLVVFDPFFNSQSLA